MKLTKQEFIFDSAPFSQCHASTVVRLEGGNKLCAWFGGEKEGESDVRIWYSRQIGGKWSFPEVIPAVADLPHWNPVLFETSRGEITLFYKVGALIPQWKTYFTVTRDGGNTWSAPKELIENDTSDGRGPVKNKPLRHSSGALLAPASTEQGRWRCFFDRSFDNGKTWTPSELLSISEEEGLLQASRDANGIIQPTVWESDDGAHALMRTTAGKIYKTDSKDFVHWCDPYPIEIPHNNSGIDAVKLPDGRVFLACNPIDTKNVRTPLSLYVSYDDGNTFEFYSHLITMPGKYHYPAMIYQNGCLHLTYSWNFNTIAYMCLTDL